MTIEAALADGYKVVGYSTCLGALGAITHHVLLQKGTELISIGALIGGQKEQGRQVVKLS